MGVTENCLKHTVLFWMAAAACYQHRLAQMPGRSGFCCLPKFYRMEAAQLQACSQAMATSAGSISITNNLYHEAKASIILAMAGNARARLAILRQALHLPASTRHSITLSTTSPCVLHAPRMRAIVGSCISFSGGCGRALNECCQLFDGATQLWHNELAQLDENWSAWEPADIQEQRLLTDSASQHHISQRFCAPFVTASTDEPG